MSWAFQPLECPPSPARAGYPSSLAWQDHRHPRELLSLALPCSFPEAAGGIVLPRCSTPRLVGSLLP